MQIPAKWSSSGSVSLPEGRRRVRARALSRRARDYSQRLSERFGTDEFQARDLVVVAGISERSARSFMKEALRLGLVALSGAGRATRVSRRWAALGRQRPG